MIAGHYEYERQTGPPRDPSEPLGALAAYFLVAFISFLLASALALCCLSQDAQTVDESATDTDDDPVDTDIVIVPNQNGHATGINDATDPVPDAGENVGQPRERLPQRGASPGRS